MSEYLGSPPPKGPNLDRLRAYVQATADAKDISDYHAGMAVGAAKALALSMPPQCISRPFRAMACSRVHGSYATLDAAVKRCREEPRPHLNKVVDRRTMVVVWRPDEVDEGDAALNAREAIEQARALSEQEWVDRLAALHAATQRGLLRASGGG